MEHLVGGKGSCERIPASLLIYKRHDDVARAGLHVQPFVLVRQPTWMHQRMAHLVAENRAVLPHKAGTAAGEVNANLQASTISLECKKRTSPYFSSILTRLSATFMEKVEASWCGRRLGCPCGSYLTMKSRQFLPLSV